MIGELAALGAALSWTVSAMLYKKALQETRPITANIVRLSCTSAILLLLVVLVGKFSVLTSLPLYAVVLASVSGVIGLGLGDTLYMMSLKSIGVARAVPLLCTYPLFSLVWQVLLLSKPISLPVVLGAVTIVAGIWLLRSDRKAEAEATGKPLRVRGVTFALATAVLWSVSITMIDVSVTLPETGTQDSAFAINTIRVTAIAICLLASAPLVDRSHGILKMNRNTLIALVAGGIVALGIGWFLLAFSFLQTSAAIAIPVSSTTPLFSTLSGVLLMHERVTARNALGSIVIVAGVFLLFVV